VSGSAQDADRDALALVAAVIRGDDAGVSAVLDYADLRAVAARLAGFLARTARMIGGNASDDDLAERFALRLRELPPE
jgi:hypothetical protein